MSIVPVIVLPWLGVALIVAGAILTPSWQASQHSQLLPLDAAAHPSPLRGIAGGLLIVLGLIVVVGPALLFAVQAFQQSDEQDRLRQTGVSAPATIVDVWDTNTTINNSPLVGLRLEVRPESGPPFTVEITQVISRLQVGLYRPGAQATVRYDAADHNKLVVVSVR